MPPELNKSAFIGNNALQQILVLSASVETYKSESGWSNYADIIVGY